jgi:hypothetical protein
MTVFVVGTLTDMEGVRNEVVLFEKKTEEEAIKKINEELNIPSLGSEVSNAKNLYLIIGSKKPIIITPVAHL